MIYKQPLWLTACIHGLTWLHILKKTIKCRQHIKPKREDLGLFLNFSFLPRQTWWVVMYNNSHRGIVHTMSFNRNVWGWDFWFRKHCLLGKPLQLNDTCVPRKWLSFAIHWMYKNTKGSLSRSLLILTIIQGLQLSRRCLMSEWPV